MSASDLVRKYFSAYENKDRKALDEEKRSPNEPENPEEKRSGF
jgi:hypothetical protein